MIYSLFLIFFFLESKIQAANQMQKLMTKYLSRLDHELHSFKKELDTDNNGITEIIEKSKIDHTPILFLIFHVMLF